MEKEYSGDPKNIELAPGTTDKIEKTPEMKKLEEKLATLFGKKFIGAETTHAGEINLIFEDPEGKKFLLSLLNWNVEDGLPDFENNIEIKEI